MKISIFLGVVLIGIKSNCFSQFKFIDSCSMFNLSLKIENPYSDTIIYRYKDCSKDMGVVERVVLNNGEIQISGFINRSSEMIINCDLNAPFEDSSFFRLLLEPGNINVNLRMNGKNIIKVVTKGSLSQNEKEKWNNDNQFLLQMQNDYLREYRVFLKSNSKNDSVQLKNQLLVYQSKIDVLSELKKKIALDYIKKNSGSYFSASLLSAYKRLYSTDTIMLCFNTFSSAVQQSDFGKYILDEVLNRSDNWEYLKAYLDSGVYKKLINIKRIFDVSLKGINGNEVSLSQFKGKILVLDFWGSWCNPCIASIPYMNQLIADLKGYPVEIISVAIGTKEDDWKKLISKYKYMGSHLNDSEGILSAYYKVLSAPKYVIIGPDGSSLISDAPSATSPLLKKTILEIVAKLYK